MVSVEDILMKKVYYPKDEYYGIIPLMACIHWDCQFCKARVVAKSKSGVIQRMYAHERREHDMVVE